jgi:hypothetical protein
MDELLVSGLAVVVRGDLHQGSSEELRVNSSSNPVAHVAVLRYAVGPFSVI